MGVSDLTVGTKTLKVPTFGPSNSASRMLAVIDNSYVVIRKDMARHRLSTLYILAPSQESVLSSQHYPPSLTVNHSAKG